MSDLFHEDVPDEFIDRVFRAMATAPRHVFQILTKRPERMRDYCSWTDILRDDLPRDMADRIGAFWPLPNVWLGVSIETQRHEDRWDALASTPAAVRFVSYEPALGPLSMSGWATLPDWLIVGGESGPGARPCNVKWVRSIVRQCRDAAVACFVKQFGAKPVGPHPLYPDNPNYSHNFPLGLKSRKGGDPSEWPEDLRVREWPK